MSAPPRPATEACFIVNLVQDVNILRPLIVMAKRDFACEVRLLVSSKLAARDVTGVWQAELTHLTQQVDAEAIVFSAEYEALAHLGGHGLIFAASESNLHGHAVPHNLFRIAPASYLRVTLQHGFECVGFRHSAAHTIAHGPDASFGADLVSAWLGDEHLSATAPSQLDKIVATGPTAVLQQFRQPHRRDPAAPGLVCENLHSVRMNVTGDLKVEFVEVFTSFCAALEADGERGRVCLRPHPGGQYTLRNNVQVPVNATVENAPMYRLDLRRFAYGISAPSSVLLDMVLAGLPTAVWRDRDGRMDTDNYSDLPGISSIEDWVVFARQARDEPESFAEGRRRMIERFQLLREPALVYERFAGIFELAQRNAATLQQRREDSGLRFLSPLADA